MIGQSRRTHKRSGFVSRFGSPATPPGFIGSHRSPQREEVPNRVGGPCSSSGGTSDTSTSDSGRSRRVGGPHSCSVTGGGGPNSLTGAQGPYWLTF